jgi:molybdopterin/thiamine biosynthesis adenylyltransferase
MTVSDTADPYARPRLIEGWSQHRLSAATAIVIGVGALGNEVAKNLALAGVGRLLLCDPDVVDTTNLSRSALFTSTDAGQAKVDAAAGALARLSQATSVVARQATLTAGVGLGELAEARLVLGCLDSRRSRQELLGRCALADVPLVDGGTGPWSGEVRVRTSLDAGCYACALTPYERGESDTPRSCAEIQPPGAEPASIATTSLVAAWMTVTALRILLALPVGYEGLRIEALIGSTAPLSFPRDPLCPYHERLPPVDQHVPITNRDPVAALLAAMPDASDVHTWTAFGVAPRCLRCGTRSEYDPRRGAGGPLRCVQCQAVLRPQSSQNLADADPSVTLDALSVAPQEILRVRSTGRGDRWVQLAG